MAIHPIDLQVMFTQMDKVAKIASQQQGSALQNAMQVEARLQKDIESKGVIEEAKKEEKQNNIKDKNSSSSNNFENQKNNQKKDENLEENEYSVITDPALGTNLDVSC